MLTSRGFKASVHIKVERTTIATLPHAKASAMLMSPTVSSAVSMLVLSKAMRILCCNVSRLDGSLSLGLLNLRIAHIMSDVLSIKSAGFTISPMRNY